MSETTKKAAEIRATLDRNHWITLPRDGVEYFISQDEDVTGWYAWRVPLKEGSRAVHSFGDVDLGDEDTPDYQELSECIAEWAAQPESAHAV